MSLAEDSEEFGDTVRHFYRTLEDQHGKISIIKVGTGSAGAGQQVPSVATAEPRTLLVPPAGAEADPPAAVPAVPAEESQHGAWLHRRRRGAHPLPRHH